MKATVRVLAPLSVAVLIGLAEAYAAWPARSRPPCPSRPRQATAVGFHFSPGAEEHQSWIDFRVPEPDATGFTLCLDGNVWETGIGHTPENGEVRVSVSTTFINAEWLSGQLASLQRPDRWQIVYTAYSLGLP